MNTATLCHTETEANSAPDNQQTDTASTQAPCAESRAAFLARRRSMIAAAYARRNRQGQTHAGNSDGFEPFTPTPRGSRFGASDAEPLLSPYERAKLALDVAIARDADEWKIGRSAPCRWLVLVG